MWCMLCDAENITPQIQVEVVKWYVMKIISQLKSSSLDETVCN